MVRKSRIGTECLIRTEPNTSTANEICMQESEFAVQYRTNAFQKVVESNGIELHVFVLLVGLGVLLAFTAEVKQEAAAGLSWSVY